MSCISLGRLISSNSTLPPLQFPLQDYIYSCECCYMCTSVPSVSVQLCVLLPCSPVFPAAQSALNSGLKHTKALSFPKKSCIFIFLISANGTNHLIHTFPRSGPCCFLSSYLIQPILLFWCLSMCQSGIWAASKRNLAKWESVERISVVYRASKRLGGWGPQKKESQVSSPLPHFHCNAFTFNPLSIQDSESQETRSHFSNSSLMRHPALSLLPSGAKGRTWPFLIPPREMERWTLTHRSHIYYVVPSKERSKTHRKE